MNKIDNYVESSNLLKKRLKALGLNEMEEETITRLPVNDKCKLSIVNKLLLDKIKRLEEKDSNNHCKSNEKDKSRNNWVMQKRV